MVIFEVLKQKINETSEKCSNAIRNNKNSLITVATLLLLFKIYCNNRDDSFKINKYFIDEFIKNLDKAHIVVNVGHLKIEDTNNF